MEGPLCCGQKNYSTIEDEYTAIVHSYMTFGSILMFKLKTSFLKNV